MQAARPFDQYRKIFKSQNNQSKELLKYVFEKSDGISLWIIGLSVGGITLFANNVANIQKTISSNYLKPILLLLAISVTSGIVYRVLFLYFFILLKKIQTQIDISFSNESFMDTESLLNGNETFEELIKAVKDNCGDLSYLLNIYNTVDENVRSTLYNSVTSHYLETVEFAKKDTDLVLEFIADTYSKFTGYSKKKYLKEFNRNNVGKQYKLAQYSTAIFYFIYILTFFTALFLFVYSV